MTTKAKSKAKAPRAGFRHREVPPPWAMPRNRDDRILDIPGPVIDVAPSESLALYRDPTPRPRPPRKDVGGRAGQAVRGVVAKVAPTVAAEPFSKARLGQTAAYTGGLVGTTVAVGELGVTASKPVAIGVTALGALGMTFLETYWQQLAQGVLGAGVAQLTAAMHSERLRAKADKEAARKRELEQAVLALATQQAHAVATQAAATAAPAPPPAAAPTPRNAFVPFDLTPAYAAVDQAQAELAMHDARNGWGWPEVEWPEASYPAAA